jgi:hypothetical protein
MLSGQCCLAMLFGQSRLCLNRERERLPRHLRCRRMTLHVAWTQAIEALQREGHGPAYSAPHSPSRRQLLDDADRYRREAARCDALAADATEPPIGGQLTTVAETYRRLARQLEALARIS